MAIYYRNISVVLIIRGRGSMADEVIICRSLRDKKFDTISIWCITGIHWSNVSDGKHKKQNGYSLYGYIPYGLLLKKNVSCSGKHFYKYNLAKICIPAYRNKEKIFYEHYIDLVKEAGVKPQRQIINNRPIDQGPCTKKLLECLSKVPFMEREELQDNLLILGYKKTTISNAIYYLSRKKKIHIVHNLCLKVPQI